MWKEQIILPMRLREGLRRSLPSLISDRPLNVATKHSFLVAVNIFYITDIEIQQSTLYVSDGGLDLQ